MKKKPAKLTVKKDRLKDVIKWLKDEKIISTQNQLLDIIAYKSASTFSAMLKGTINIPDRLLVAVANLDKRVDVEWLKTGTGEMLKNKGTIQSIHTNNDGKIIGSQVNGNGNNVDHHVSENDQLIAIIAKQQEQMDKLINAIIKLKAK